MNYYCDVCSIKFKNRSIFICHLASNHRGPFPLVDVTKYIDEHGHKKTTKAIENRHLIANSCDSEFTLSDVNNEFCKVDSGRTQLLRLYTCHCKASFKHKSWYLKHQLTHKAGTLECDKCSKVFKRKDNLRRHLTKHFGGTIYKCQKCPSTFNIKFNLSYHMKTKHGNVCFSCPKCDKNFRDSRQLNYHDNRIHTGLMPFECIVCNMRFHAPNDLYRHRKLKNH